MSDDRSDSQPQLLAPLVPGPDADPEPDYDDIVWAALPDATLAMLHNNGLTVQDVLDGNVPGLDPDQIIADARAYAAGNGDTVLG